MSLSGGRVRSPFSCLLCVGLQLFLAFLTIPYAVRGGGRPGVLTRSSFASRLPLFYRRRNSIKSHTITTASMTDTANSAHTQNLGLSYSASIAGTGVAAGVGVGVGAVVGVRLGLSL